MTDTYNWVRPYPQSDHFMSIVLNECSPFQYCCLIILDLVKIPPQPMCGPARDVPQGPAFPVESPQGLGEIECDNAHQQHCYCCPNDWHLAQRRAPLISLAHFLIILISNFQCRGHCPPDSWRLLEQERELLLAHTHTLDTLHSPWNWELLAVQCLPHLKPPGHWGGGIAWGYFSCHCSHTRPLCEDIIRSPSEVTANPAPPCSWMPRPPVNWSTPESDWICKFWFADDWIWLVSSGPLIVAPNGPFTSILAASTLTPSSLTASTGLVEERNEIDSCSAEMLSVELVSWREDPLLILILILSSERNSRGEPFEQHKRTIT